MYTLKQASQKLIQPLMKIGMKMHPDAITMLSILFAAGAGLCFYKSGWGWTLWGGPVCITFRLCCNLLDGMVARARNIASSRGEALQEAVDRIADTVILLGIAFSPYASPILALFAIPIVLFSSYLGILYKAVGKTRLYNGIMGKVDRLILIMVFSIIQFFWQDRLWDLYAFGVLLWLIITGGIITIIQRSLIIRKFE